MRSWHHLKLQIDMRKTNDTSAFRYNIFKIAIIILAVVIGLRLFQIQVLNSPKYKAQAREEHWHGITLHAKRGDILTSDDFSIASNESKYVMYVDVERYNVDQIVDILSKYDGWDANDFSDKKNISDLGPSKNAGNVDDEVNSKQKKENEGDNSLQFNDDLQYAQINDSDKFTVDKDGIERQMKKKRGWAKVSDQITWEIKDDLEKQNLGGIYFEEYYSRYYPEQTMLSHVLGLVGDDKEGQKIGYYGLEQFYNGDLAGQDGYLYQEKSANGTPILLGKQEVIEPIDGSDLVLTIDRNVQYIIEHELEVGVKKYNAKSGTAIILDPKTGYVLAMANVPTYYPLRYKDVPEEVIRNDAISTVYEPGSVIKALTIATGIDLNYITPNTVYHDNGPKYFSGHLVDNWDGKHHGEETMISVLQHSNNLGAAWVGLKVGDKNLMKYFKEFSFGQKLGIDLDGEESGIIYNKFPMKDIEIANASFGQGIATTPLQVAVAFSAFANNGKIMKPMVVKKIITKDKTIDIKPILFSEPISKTTAETMTEMLRQAVAGGEAKFFVSKKYNISGKTGTAQIPEKGGYAKDRTNATFVGYFTNYKNFVMLIKLEEPRFPSSWSSETAVPLWMNVAEKLAVYYGLPPDIELNN